MPHSRRRTDPRTDCLRYLLPELLRRATQNSDAKGAIMDKANILASAIDEERPRRITDAWLDGVIGPPLGEDPACRGRR